MKLRKYAKWSFIVAGLLVAGGIIAGVEHPWLGIGMVYFGFWSLFVGWMLRLSDLADEHEQEAQRRHGMQVKASEDAIANARIVESMVWGYQK